MEWAGEPGPWNAGGFIRGVFLAKIVPIQMDWTAVFCCTGRTRGANQGKVQMEDQQLNVALRCVAGALVRVFGIQILNVYIERMESKILPFAQIDLQGDYIFHQDNPVSHVSLRSGKWSSSYIVNVLPWPAISSTLNIIQNVWSCLVRILKKRARFYIATAELYIA